MIDDVNRKNFSNGARLAVPILLLLAMALASVVHLPLPYAGDVRPDVVLMAIYYWSIYRPTLVPPFLCFGLGILTDLLTGMPLGLNAVIFVVVQWIVRDQRRFMMGQPYVVLWAIYSLIAVATSMVLWSAYGLSHLNWPPLAPLGVSVLLSAVLFPLITILLIFMHRLLPVASRAYP